jgi:hypothetical protein
MDESKMWQHKLYNLNKPKTKKTLISKIKSKWQKNQLKK